MQWRSFTFPLISVFVFLVAQSCSGPGNPNPVVPPVTAQNGILDTNRTLWGYYEVIYDPDTESAELVPQRQISGHLNIVKFLEQWPCSNCAQVTGVTSNPSGSKTFSFKITHPFTNMTFTGFDVRGIVMFNGSHNFPASELKISDSNTGEGELLNAQGYTSLFNSTTLGYGPGGLEGYIKGKYATPAVPGATLNGYRRHITSGSQNGRLAFYAADAITQSYEIKMPTGGLVFGYAIDVSWAPPTTTPVTDPQTDFPSNANSFEPWKIEVTKSNIGIGLNDHGGSAKLTIDVCDHQGYESHGAPKAECPELFDGTVTAAFLQDYGDYSRWEAVIENTKLAPAGPYKVLVKVVDIQDASSPDWLDLSAYQIKKVTVIEFPEQHGWARTWGDIGQSNGIDTATDESGNIYVTGIYFGSVDMDPGSGTDIHTSQGYDAFLSKFTPDGDYIWGRTWGGSGDDSGRVVCYRDGRIWVTGTFCNLVDFNPTDGFALYSSNGSYDVFMCEYTNAGEFEGVLVWGGTGLDIPYGFDVTDSGIIYCGGKFSGSDVDFDPGSGSDLHTSSGSVDCFISKYLTDGTYQWTATWGGTKVDEVYGICTDSSNSVYSCGFFNETIDFDPSSGVDQAISAGVEDCFLSKIDENGVHQWAYRWGGVQKDQSTDIAYDGIDRVYVIGNYSATVDFDPGPGVQQFTSVGSQDVFLSKYTTGGNFQDAWAWGGDEQEMPTTLAVDGDSIVISGYTYSDIVDFDHTSGTDMHSNAGSSDFYIKRMMSDGTYLWTVMWGSTGSDKSLGVCVDFAGNIITTGGFMETVDFDPSISTDNHAAIGLVDFYLMKVLPDGMW